MIFRRLNQFTREAPPALKYISWYNQVNFWGSMLMSVIAFVFLALLPAGGVPGLNPVLLILLLLAIVALNFMALLLTRRLLQGSWKAYLILLSLLVLQMFSFRTGDSGYYLGLGGIPVNAGFWFGATKVKINIPAVMIGCYLIGIRRELAKK